MPFRAPSAPRLIPTPPCLRSHRRRASRLAIDAGRNLQNITFDFATVGAMTIGTTGGNALHLTSGGAITTTALVAATETVNAPLVLEGTGGSGAAYTFSSNAAAAANVLNFGGGITGGATDYTTLTIAGTNTGLNTISGDIADGTYPLAIVKGDTGTWVLANVLSSYSGGTTINGGTLSINGDGALGAAAGPLNFGTDPTLLTATLTALAATTLNPSRTVTINSGFTAVFDSNSNAMEVQGGIQGGGNLTKVNGGTLTLSGSNSYSGATTVAGGTLLLNSTARWAPRPA